MSNETIIWAESPEELEKRIHQFKDSLGEDEEVDKIHLYTTFTEDLFEKGLTLDNLFEHDLKELPLKELPITRWQVIIMTKNVRN